MAGDGECWLKRKKKTKHSLTDCTLIQMGNASNGLKTKRNFSRGSVWVTDGFSLCYFTLSVRCLKGIHDRFFSMNVLTKTTIAGLGGFHSKNRVCVCLPACVCMHVFACTAFKNNYGLVWLRRQQQAGGWNTNSPQMRPLPLSGFKDFCLLSHFWIQAQT